MKLIRSASVYVLLALLAGCSSLGVGLESPKVQLTAIDLLETQALSQRFRIGLTLVNPNSVALPLKGMSYSLALDGVQVAHGANSSLPTLPAYSETQLDLEATASLMSALRLLNQMMKNQADKPVSYTLSAKIDVEGLGRPVKIEERGEVPLR